MIANLLRIICSKASSVEQIRAGAMIVAALKKEGELNLSEDGTPLAVQELSALARILEVHKISLNSFYYNNRSLRNPLLVEAFVQVLNQCPHLIALSLAHSPLSDASMPILFKALETIKLKTLNLSGTYFPYPQLLKQYLIENRNLVCLDLNDNALDQSSFEELIVPLASHPLLFLLDIGGNWIGNECFVMFLERLHQQKNKTLRYLMLGKNGLDDRSAIELAKYLDYNSNLYSLKIASEEISEKGTQVLTQAVARHPSLANFEFSTCLTFQPLLIEEMIRKNPRLKSLILGHNMIVSKVAATLIRAIPENGSLAELSFHHNHIGSEEREIFDDFLNALLENKTLRHINLTGNAIHNHRALAFINTFVQSGLLSFKIDFSKLSDSTIQEIAKMLSRVANRTLDKDTFGILKDAFLSGMNKFILLEAIRHQNFMVSYPKPILVTELKKEESAVESVPNSNKVNRMSLEVKNGHR